MNLVRLLIIIFASLVLSGCDPLRALIDKHFPPVSTTDQQYASVETNLRTIGDLTPHVGVHIDRELLTRYLPAEIKAAAEAVEDKNVVVHQLDPKISFDKQGIFIDADFSITVPEHRVDIKGTFTGVTSVSTELDNLYLRSALSSLKLTSIKFTKKPSIGKKVLAELLVVVLRNYINNLNGQILRKPTVINIAWGNTYSPKIEDMFREPGTEITTEPISVSRFIKRSSIRIGANGISVLAELTKDKPVNVDVTPERTTRRTNAELISRFREYDKQFEDKWLSIFEPVNPDAGITANVSKSEIANVLNETLSKPITLKQNFTLPRTEFNKNLEVKRGDIDCQKTRKEFSYNRYKRDRCNWDCKWWDELCRRSKDLCNIKEEAKVAADNIKRESEYAAHQLANEARVTACNVKREAMDFMALGRFKGSVSGDGNASVTVQSLRFKDDLSEIAMTYSGDVDAKLKSHLELNPVDLGHVFFCYSNYSLNTSGDLDIGIPGTTSKIIVTSVRSGEDLTLKINLDEIKYEASIAPSPLHELLADPKFHSQCPVSRIVGLTVGAAAAAKLLDMIKLAPEQELLLLGKVKGKYGLEEMQIPIKPINFKINRGQEQKALIFWNTRSLQFKTLKHRSASE